MWAADKLFLGTEQEDLTLTIRGLASKGDWSLWVGPRLKGEEAEAREGVQKTLGKGKGL